MHTKTILASIILSLAIVGCGSSSDSTTTNESNNSDNTTSSSRFQPLTMSNNTIMQDKTNNVEWVNGEGGCHPMVSGKSAQVAFDESVAHCEGLSFAGHSDWRVPTILEAQSFTVGMNDDGITPFYKNAGCPRIVGYNADKTAIQNTNTHNTPPIGTITNWGELNAGVRCIRDTSTTTGTTNTTRFAPMTMGNDIIMQDNTTDLEWVNGPGGCHPMLPGKSAATAFTESVTHCEGLSFSGHTDWRLPTITEIQKYTVDMNTAGITPFYQNLACPRVVGYNDDKTAILNTNTHNTPPIGTITAWGDLNAGARCVRDK